jgi:hypothetical protein
VDPESSSVHVSYWLDRTTAKNAIIPAIDHPSKKEMVEQQRFRTQIIEMKKEVARPRGRFQNSELIRLERSCNCGRRIKKSPGKGRDWNAGGGGGGGGGADDVPPPHPLSTTTSGMTVNQASDRHTLLWLTPTGAVFMGISKLEKQPYTTSLTSH